MLETGEVDDDYFTPSGSCTLDSIFVSNKQSDSKDENDSLKYTPPKPNISQKTEEPKATQCIFACTSLVHEWSNNMYTSKGNLGLAIMKNVQNNSHYLVIYDSSKTKISFSVITSKFEIKINEQNYLSYYDSNNKYWSIHVAEDKIKDIIDILKSCNAIIQQSPYTNKGPPDLPNTTEIDKIIESKTFESDTDSSFTKNTKASILNRMANMGQSVLPPRPNISSKTSDSSDNNDTYEYPKIRHKPVKTVPKRNLSNEINVSLSKQEQTESSSLFHSNVNSQLVPVARSNIICNSNDRDIDTLLSEQRLNCSELRINVNRLSDKIDTMMNKMNNIKPETSVISSNLQNEILQKLLTEYENKIKSYEELLKVQPNAMHNLPSNSKSVVDNSEIDNLKGKVRVLETAYEVRGVEMTELQKEVNSLKDTLREVNNDAHLKENNMTHKILQLENTLKSKDEEILNLYSLIKNTPVANANREMGDRIKKIMNDAYRAISSYFEDNEMYSGENIKNIIGLAIKKVTVESLKQL